MKYIWRVWVKSLGAKADEDDTISDHVAIVRTLIVIVYVVTNCFIVANIVKNWN
jgi:hypothetical protein